MQTDAIVVGAGIVGAACGYALARSGLAVTVLEAAAAASGTSGQGEGNLLISDKEPGPELALARYSLGLWDALEETLRDRLPPGLGPIEYERKGGLVVATTDAGVRPLLRFAASQRAAGVDARPIDHEHALALEPALNPAVTAAVHYPEDAQVQPVIATETLLAAARSHGGRTLFGQRVTGPIRDAGGRLVGVRTATGEHRAGHVVLACGPWSGAVADRFGARIPVGPRRGVILVTSRMPHRIFGKVYDADYVGAVGSDDQDLQTSSVIESTAAGNVLVGSSRRRSGFDQSFDLEAIAEIAAKAIRIFPFLATASVIRSYGGFRPFMPDHLPAIGPDPRVKGLWHATGHEGAGIGLSLGTAEMITDLITGREPHLDAAPFDPGRPALQEVTSG
ncbi:Glycine/D-amino acid oxidase [Microlunatus soli]|uniref:Glycine/D-amino acid oxidase n=1 Tax=Microlunatus soli TaxID=630515 RepID=A0A1H1SIK6_9ACTN|nr:Glycine/D-amino acid oxidase [Microlunatus soli]